MQVERESNVCLSFCFCALNSGRSPISPSDLSLVQLRAKQLQQPPSSPAPAASSEKKGLIVRRPSGRASLEKDVPTAAAKKNADSTRKVSDPGGVGRCGPNAFNSMLTFFFWYMTHDNKGTNGL